MTTEPVRFGIVGCGRISKNAFAPALAESELATLHAAASRDPARAAALKPTKVYDDYAALLADPDVMSDRDQFTALSKEYAEIEPVIACFRKYESLTSELNDARALAQDDDPEMRELAEEDVKRLTGEVEETEAELQLLLLPRDPNDSANVFLEIRAGTGGDEAAIFSGDLFRM